MNIAIPVGLFQGFNWSEGTEANLCAGTVLSSIHIITKELKNTSGNQSDFSSKDEGGSKGKVAER
jgi:hypothetical protein